MRRENNNESGAGTIGAMVGGVVMPGLVFAITLSGPITAVALGVGIMGGAMVGKKVGNRIESKTSNYDVIEDKRR